MTIEKEADFNVIFLPNHESEMEEMIQSYLDILESCKTKTEKEALIRMVAYDARIITLREICTEKIKLLAKVLEQTKDHENW